MATSGRWCHMAHLDHVTPVGGGWLQFPVPCFCLRVGLFCWADSTEILRQALSMLSRRALPAE